MQQHRKKQFRFFFLLLVWFGTIGCSPFYVVQAGVEGAGILLCREDISKMLDVPDTDAKLKYRLELVLQARDFARDIGLKPKGSYTQYSEVDRDVLVWVLSAAPKTSLDAMTWWFPFAGRVPYKGFFEKEDALQAAQTLREKNYDVFVRPSLAYSTLGWFDDPLLSTHLRMDNIGLVDTIIHELVHNTVWIQDAASFNETLANVFAGLATPEFFRRMAGEDSISVQEAGKRLQDELLFGKFIGETYRDLSAVFAQDISTEEKLDLRDRLLRVAQDTFAKLQPDLRTKQYASKSTLQLDNAQLIAYHVYLDQPAIFYELFIRCDRSLTRFIRTIQRLQQELGAGEDPFQKLQSMSCVATEQ